MAELKTRRTAASVAAFIAGVKDPALREDCGTLVELMRKVTGAEPAMWGTRIVGFGQYRYTGSGGRGGDWMVTGFSPGNKNLTVYLMSGVARYPDLLATLGKHSTGVSCLYLKRLADVHMPTLEKLIAASARDVPNRTE